MAAVLIVGIVVVVVGLIGAALFSAHRAAVRGGCALSPGPGRGGEETRPRSHRSVRRCAAPGVDADRHHADRVTGHHHRDNVSVDVSAVAYYRVVDATEGTDRDRKRRHRDQPDRSDHTPQGCRPAHA